MIYLEIALQTSQDRLFDTAKTDPYDYMPISVWERVLNEECESKPCRIIAAICDEPNVENENRPTESRCPYDEFVVTET